MNTFDGMVGDWLPHKGNCRCPECQIDRQQTELRHLSESHRELMQRAESIAFAAYKLVDAMETCHICKGTILASDEPVHCEDCSYDCDDHDGPECETIESLHRNLKAALAEARKEANEH